MAVSRIPRVDLDFKKGLCVLPSTGAGFRIDTLKAFWKYIRRGKCIRTLPFLITGPVDFTARIEFSSARGGSLHARLKLSCDVHDSDLKVPICMRSTGLLLGPDKKYLKIWDFPLELNMAEVDGQVWEKTIPLRLHTDYPSSRSGLKRKDFENGGFVHNNSMTFIWNVTIQDRSLTSNRSPARQIHIPLP